MTRQWIARIFLLVMLLIAWDLRTLELRCQYTPALNLNIVLLGLSLQALSIFSLFLDYKVAWTEAEPKVRLLVLALTIGLAFVGSVTFRQSDLYSDTVGQKNWKYSVGLKCGG